ncbi:MAG: Fe-S cluster assembly protein SufD, partial [Cyanobacteriota bacterium]
MSASLAVPTSSKAAWLESWLTGLPAPSGTLQQVQQRGREALSRLPLPSSRQEDWRFTDLGLLSSLPLAQSAAPAPLTLPSAAAGVCRLEWNGTTDPLAGQSLPAGLQLLSAAEVAQG